MLINIADNSEKEEEVKETLTEISKIRMPLTKAKRK